MSKVTEGYVLKAPLSAPANARSTTAANSGVSRSHADVPGSYVVPGDLVESAADQYRAAVLLSPDTGTREYLLWAANSSNLAVLEDPSWSLTDGTGSIPTGSLTVLDTVNGVRTDGTNRVIVTDNGGRSLAGILGVILVRGDTGAILTVTTFAATDATSGVATLDAATLVLLSGGLSRTRGDVVAGVQYYIAAQRFWWTRNDPQSTRFAWDGRVQRWVPLRGGAPRNLGYLLNSTTYTLVPRPSRYVVGDYLPGDPSTPDAYASVRVGRVPDSSYGVPVRVLVVTDDQAADPGYSFPPNTDAVVGFPSGLLVFNSSFVDSYAGQNIWYVQDNFPQTLVDGDVGALIDAGEPTTPLFLSPVPDRGECPQIRIGSRSYLRAVGVDSDLALSSAAPLLSSGEVAFSRSTGKLAFFAGDVAKSDPDNVLFDVLYLGAHVFYDGVALTEQPIRTRDPVALVGGVIGAANNMYVPAAVPMPAPGVSGVDLVPDGTGLIPNSSVVPVTRPNGSGLVRSMETTGEVLIFGRTAAMETVEIVEFEDELPDFAFLIAKGLSVVAREQGALGSKVAVGSADRTRFAGEQLYFLQTDVQPAQYTVVARIGSQRMGPFTLSGAEVLAFEVDGTAYLWLATSLGINPITPGAPGAGVWTAAEVASSIAATITGTGTSYALRDRVWIESADPLGSGTVSIGFGSITSGAFTSRDLSGCAALGFLPGWRTEASTDNWLPDAGLAFGVMRSQLNLDRMGPEADFRATYRVHDSVVADPVSTSSVVTFTNPPLEDVAGYDTGVFFTLLDGYFIRFLRPYEQVVYRFATGRMLWAEQHSVVGSLRTRTEVLSLGSTGVFGESLHPAVGSGFGLYLSPSGGARTLLTEGVDYILPSDGAPGLAPLITILGGMKSNGAKGSFTIGSTTFTDPDATFVTSGVGPGWRLKLVTGSDTVLGSYEVLSVTTETSLEVRSEVPFPLTQTVVSWELYEGFDRAVYDPTVVVDVVSLPFSPLGDEAFAARILTPIGVTPMDPADQSANRLVADVAEGVASGRSAAVRFGGAVGDPEVAALSLSTVLVGEVGDTLYIPSVIDPHFTDSTPAFAIIVGSTTYTVAGLTLLPVSVFTTNLSGDVIEYGEPGSGTIEGQLNLGTDVLTVHAGANVYYAPQFRDPTLMLAGDAEFSPYTGEINLSDADLTTYGGTAAYWVEDQVAGVDVQLGPIQGTVFLRRPMRAYQVLEVSYSRANTDGTLYIDSTTGQPVDVVEQLPLFVRLETATRIDARTYSFDPTGRTVRADIAAAVWVGSRLVTTGNIPLATVDGATSRITFRDDVDPAATVKINYAVVQAFGGEQSYTVSAPPVWRAPLVIPVNGTTFMARGDRTAELPFGAVLAVGTVAFYIADTSYDAATDATVVTVWPPAPVEAGTRNPGAGSPATVTNVPVAVEVDGVPASGNAGFLMSVTAAYIPVDRGQVSITVVGDVTQYAQEGHLFEIGGYPALVASSNLSENGSTTVVHLRTPFQRGFDPTNDAIRLSVRPIYPTGSRITAAMGPVVSPPTATYEVVRYGGLTPQGAPKPGRTLVPTVEYTVDEGTGSITLLSLAAPIQSTDRIVVSFTRRAAVAPYVVDGMAVFPTYSAGYVHVSTPSEENGYLNATLVARYTFRSPDTFYVRSVSMPDWMGEVAVLAAREVSALDPHGGPTLTISPPQTNWSYGTSPFGTRRRENGDRDRAARRYIALYDGFIRGFEQILETIDGRVVGDRDGKFRFWVGQGEEYAPPGYEDEITGNLNPRNVWSLVFEQVNGSFGVTFKDPLVEPLTASQDPVTLVVSGDAMNPDRIAGLVGLQRKYVLNDMDDRVVIGSAGVTMSHDAGSSLPLYYIAPDYSPTWAPSILSRLYPEATLAFGTTYPGVGFDRATNDPGRYVFLTVVAPTGDEVFPHFASTFLKEILPIQNPTLGVITNVQSAAARKRFPRGRVWAYSDVGFPELDTVVIGEGYPSFTANPRPAAIVTPLELADFPIDLATGMPDVTQLIRNGGSLFDLSTGDVTLSTPPWVEVDSANKVLPQVSFGVPDGTTYKVGYTGGLITSILSGVSISPTYPGVFVGEVIAGCIVTFAQMDGTNISDSSELAIIGAGNPGDTLPFAPVQGDTLYVVAPVTSDTVGTASDPPTVADVTGVNTNSPLYRSGFDVEVANRQGAFRDLSLPSLSDPSPLPLKELTGQNPVTPVTCIEAAVEFTNANLMPLAFPAMRGEQTNDSGDYTIPYLSVSNTELDRLGAAASAFTSITETDSPVPNAVYPDEVVADASTFTSAVSSYPPAAIVATGADFTPVTTAGSYTPHTGIGDVSEFDLILVETGSAALAGVLGAEGILHVGSVSAQVIEPPRFISPSRVGDRIRYRLNNAMTHVSTTGSSGVVVEEVGGTDTTFDITSVGGLFLNDGTPATVSGGLNNILNPAAIPFPNGNKVTIEIIDRATSTIVETITIDGKNITGGAGSVILLTPATATDKLLTIPGTGFVNFVALGTVAPGPTTEFDFKISIDTFNSLSADTQGSYTAYVDTDRLTFRETLDLRTALPRGTVYPSSAIIMQCSLEVVRVTASGAESDVNYTTFTFLARDAVYPNVVGYFDPSPGTGYGYVKPSGFEGRNNVPLTPITSAYRIAAMPSSQRDASGIIFSGTGDVYDDSNAVISAAGFGSATNVEPGDVLTIRQSATGDAAVTAGTYIVRHAIAPSGFGDYREAAPSITVGGVDGWLRTALPVVRSSDSGLLTVTTSGVRTVTFSPSGYDWDATGRLFLFPNSADLTTSVSMVYSGFVVNLDGTATFTFTSGTGEDAIGLPVADAPFFAAATGSVQVSGAVFIPIGDFGGGFPANNTVARTGGGRVHGFLDITTNNLLFGAATTFTSGGGTVFDSNTTWPAAPVTIPPTVGVLATDTATGLPPVAAGTYQSDSYAPVYEEVPVFLDMRGLFSPLCAWSTLTHGVTAFGVRCLAPGDIVQAQDGTGANAFRAQAGIYVEPSSPQAALDLADGVPKVVDATHTMADADVGIPNPSIHGVSPESVAFQVRRVRRWHAVLDGIGDSLPPLRFAYEIRTGTVSSYVAATRTLTAIPDPVSGGGTQLGAFNNPNVNVNAGDEVRLLDTNGDVLDTAEIAKVIGGSTLWLRAPGFQKVLPVNCAGKSFQVYLKQAPVPHMQSNEQLLELVTDRVIIHRVADPSMSPTANGGGYVLTTNELRDDGVDLTPVQIGDIVIVDPAGALAGSTGAASPVEYGVRPFGDQSVPERGPGVPYVAGRPSELDDNRGFYRVTDVASSGSLPVTGLTDFSGSAGASVVFGAVGQEYAVLPTINASTLPGSGGMEGQMDLRRTHNANGSNSYAGSAYSIAPFSYRIIRPTGAVSADTVDFVLFLRERMLSWVEELQTAFDARKQGSYFVFQRDEHISNLGSPTDATDGLGVPSNLYISGLSGLTTYAPFANTSDCLSVLDRRYWCLDYRLDTEAPSGLPTEPYSSFAADNSSGSTYTVGSGRPVEPDRIDAVLDRTDRLRQLRFSWVRYRAGRIQGTLSSMDRLLASEITSLAAAADLANIEESEGNT